MTLPELATAEIEVTKQRLLTLDVIGLLANPKIFGGPHGGGTIFNHEADEFYHYYEQVAAKGYEIIQVQPDAHKASFEADGPAAGIVIPENFGQVLLAQPEIQLHALLSAIVQVRNYSIGSKRQDILQKCVAELEQSLQNAAQHETLYFTLTANLEITL